MKRAMGAGGLVLTLALVLGSCAETPKGGAGRYVRPPSEDAFLDNLRGHWLIERHAHGKVVQNTMDAGWVLQHQFIAMHMVDVKSPPEYEAMVLVGWDAAHSLYVAHWCDNFGPGYSAVGYGTRAGESVEFRFQYDDGPFFNTFTWHPETGAWTFRGENGAADGSRKLFMEDVATRR